MGKTGRRLAITLLLLLLFSSPILIYAAGSLATIVTVAGAGTGGFSGDGGVATMAELNTPSAVAIDQAGNLYIADMLNHCVRKIITASGVITTIAGTGVSGFNGDNRLAITAQLDRPTGIAVDEAGNLYIAEPFYHRIRKVIAASGIITTVAGTGSFGYNGDDQPAITANLDRPFDVTVDRSGNLYIADAGNHRIRKVIAASGLITTVAGSGISGYNGDNQPATDARLNFPFGITVDGMGNLYIADHDNHRVRKVIVASGIITTVAGTGNPGYNGDNQSATTAELNFPYKTAIDSKGNLYIAEEENHRIRKVTVEGIITTIAGNGVPGYNGDNRLATATQLNFPMGIAIDARDNFFIADSRNHRIRQIKSDSYLYLPVILKN